MLSRPVFASVLTIAAAIGLLVTVLLASQSEAQGEETALPQGATVYEGITHVAYLGPTLSVEEALTNALDTVTTVWAYDATRLPSPWTSWNAALPAALQGFTQLEFGTAYFVVSGETNEWDFAPGDLPPIAGQQALVAGGNSIIYLGPTQSVDDALAIQAAQVRVTQGGVLPVNQIWRVDGGVSPAEQWRLWDRLLPEGLRAFDTLEFARAYFVVAAEPATWIFGPTIASAFSAVDATEVRIVGAEVEQADEFGWSSAISGDTMVISAPFDDDLGTDAGALYVYDLIDGVWTQTARLMAENGGEADWFARWVKIDGDLIAAGSPFFDPQQDGQAMGAVYLFQRENDGWTQIAQVTPSDPHRGTAFGYLLDVEGDLLAVGAPGEAIPEEDEEPEVGGAVYVFRRQGDDWIEVAKLKPPVPILGDDFGGEVAIEGEVIIVGSPERQVDGAFGAGTVYVFEPTAAGWEVSSELRPPSVAPLDSFGAAIDIQNGLVAVGSRADITGENSGVVYLFERDAASWAAGGSIRAPIATILGADTVRGDWFGFSVNLHGDLLAVGAPRRDHDTLDLIATGSAYLFQRSQAGWQQVAQLLPNDAAEAGQDGNFGWRVAMNDTHVVVGAWLVDTDAHGENSGAAYAFELP